MGFGLALVIATIIFLILYRFSPYIRDLKSTPSGVIRNVLVLNVKKEKTPKQKEFPTEKKILFTFRDIMASIVTIPILACALYIILSQNNTAYDEWAYGVIGIIVGFWLKSGSSD